MAVYRTVDFDTEELQRQGQRVRELLIAGGADLGPRFEALGVPLVTLNDITRETFDPAAFRGRLVLNGRLYSGDYLHTPGGPVRITIIRWGTEPDQCGFLKVGEGTDLNSTSIVSYIGITIGAHVHVEPRVMILDSPGHPIDRRMPDIMENKRMAPIVIHDNAWIGFGSTILPGVTVGRNAVVKPGSVVMWDVPENGIVGGNPAKAMKIYRKYFAGVDSQSASVRE